MKAITAISSAALAFSFYPLLNSIALDLASPFLLAFLVQCATIIVGFCALITMNKSNKTIMACFADYKKLPFDIFIIPIISGIGIYLGGLFFLFALSLMSKAGAAIIMESWPIIAIVMAPIALNKNWQKLNVIDGILIFISLIGLLFITASEEKISLNDFMNNPLFLFSDQNFYGTLGIVMALLSALCFAASSIARSAFAHNLPTEFRIKHFKRTETVSESIFTYLLTYLCGLPLALFSLLLMEDTISFEISATLPILLIGLSLVITSSLYSYALLITDNSNINLIWYISPLLAAVWLTVFGFSQITPMLVIGGVLIISANVILILKSRKPNTDV